MAVCSKVPEIFEVKPFCISCSMRPLTLRKLNRLSRRHDVKIFKGTGSRVIGLKFAGSSLLPFL